jgi:hypothetical protein
MDIIILLVASNTFEEGTFMTEPINPYASPEYDLSRTPFAEGSALATPGLRTTGAGLALVYYGIIFILLALVMFFPGIILLRFIAPAAVDPARPPDLSAFFIFTALVGVFIIVGGLLNFAGHIVCLFVPPQTGTRGYIIAAVVFQILDVAWFAQLFMQRLSNPNPRSEQWFSILINLSGLASAFFFVLFMRKLARFIERRDFVVRARNILFVGILFLGVFGIIFLQRIAFPSELLSVIIAIVLLIVALICFVMYANLINALRKVLLGREPSPKNPASPILEWGQTNER